MPPQITSKLYETAYSVELWVKGTLEAALELLSLHTAATQTLQVLWAGPRVPERGSLTGLRQAALDADTQRRS